MEDPDRLVEDDDEDDNAGGRPKTKETYLNKALSLCRISRTHWQRGELEKAIETLDEAYGIILDLDPENDPKMLQEKEDLRITISKRILEIYNSRRVVMNGRRNEIPVTLNKYVQDEIDSFTSGRERDFFMEAYRRSGKFRPRIEEALKEAGLPAELSWLPLIESGYKMTALSPARALGLWQFIPSTGYRYGLNRDTYIDERLDPDKATRAAIDYLKDLHGMFGDWATVLAAYNCGEHRVLRTIQSQNVNYLDNFWDLYERLPRETARYVPRFLATLHIVGARKKYGLEEAPLTQPLPFETVSIPRQTSLKGIAKTTGVDEDLLRELNAELRQGILPADGYELKVPQGEGAGVAAKIDEFPAFNSRELDRPRVTPTVVQHKVRQGETVNTIAKKYGTDTASILLANNMLKASPLSKGQLLRIPSSAYRPERQPAPAPAKAAPSKIETTDHVVRHGDSLWNIAKRYGTTAEKIQRTNQVTPASLTIGQVLKIQPVEAARNESPKIERKPARQKTHVVRQGETPMTIAKLHNVSLDRLLQINRMQTRSKIQPGQILIID